MSDVSQRHLYLTAAIIGGLLFGTAAAVSTLAPEVVKPPVLDTLPTAQLDFRHSLGFVLKSYRTSFGLTQTRLGQLTGLKATRISSLERGLAAPQLFEAKRMYYVFDSLAQAHLSDSTFTYMKSIYTQLLDSIIGGKLGIR